MFEGRVDKIEPQAVVTQGVTFFPVLVSLTNRDNLLLPGMNGEVTIDAGDRPNVLTIPIEATRTPTELASISRVFGMSLDSLTARLRPELVPSGDRVPVNVHFAVVALSDRSYELRQVQLGATDYTVVEILDGLRVGDRVVLFGNLGLAAPALPPRLQIASSIARAAHAATQPGGTAR